MPRPNLDGVEFKKITRAEEDLSTAEFTPKEIEEAVSSCESSKSPGPDGFNFEFIKKYWHVVKDDFVRMFREFHSNGKLPRGCNASLLALIPKRDSPTSLDEYRPISLVGAGYKILTKMLAEDC